MTDPVVGGNSMDSDSWVQRADGRGNRLADGETLLEGQSTRDRVIVGTKLQKCAVLGGGCHLAIVGLSFLIEERSEAISQFFACHRDPFNACTRKRPDSADGDES